MTSDAPSTRRCCTVLIAAFLFAPGCTNPSRTATTTPKQSPSTTTAYGCPGGYRFTAAFQPDRTLVTLGDGQTLTLPQVVSASGAKYQVDSVTLWNKGSEVRLETGTGVYEQCSARREATPVFHANGQEPGWRLDIDSANGLRLVADYGKTAITMPTSRRTQSSDGTVTYAADTDARSANVTVQPSPCHDSMSGESFPFTVAVQLDNRRLSGCGRGLATHSLRGIRWRLVELAGRRVVATDPERQPFLEFDGGDMPAVSGSTGCNRLRGPVSVSDQALRFGDLVMTRMACVDPALNRQEQELVRVLGTVDHYSVRSGELLLHAGSTIVARFTSR